MRTPLAAPHFETVYKAIRAHPRLAFKKLRTAKRLADEMRTLGFEVIECVARVRHALDALPMTLFDRAEAVLTAAFDATSPAVPPALQH